MPPPQPPAPPTLAGLRHDVRNPRALFARESVRYLVAGGANTAFSYGVYRVLLTLVSYPVAYSVGYVSGLVGSYLLNVYFVFRERPRVGTVLSYPAVYLAPYLLGLGLLRVLVGGLGVDPRWAPFVILVINVPLTFLLTRTLLRWRRWRGGRAGAPVGSGAGPDAPPRTPGAA